MAINGDERLNPLRAGSRCATRWADSMPRLRLLAALFHRERSGEGQFIDVALLDSIMPLAAGWRQPAYRQAAAGAHGQR